ncbi:MAG TPA: serine/threonine-protein kinase, partial [Polyangiaceae bacterium]|nr:serine/threonine-protein kinase [Polyangiaceae bacterium]
MKPGADPQLSAGSTVGGYRIEGPLGRGGMGAVYAAVEPTIGKRVAIKVVLRELAADPRLLGRFEREAKAVGRVRHPAVVEVFAYGKLDDGRPYFVMPLYPGKSLRQRLDDGGALAPREAWRVAREIAEGLHAAHREGVLHRDLKPDNVLLVDVPGRPSQPVVVDFGLAKLAQADGSDPDAAPERDLTGTQGAMGTPAYMAPEQWWSRPATARTDQYQFGALLFEMLAGRPPFVSQKLPELLEQHLHAAPPALASVGAHAPDGADAFVARLMAKDEQDRFSDFAEAISEGRRIFEGASSPALADPHAATELPSASPPRDADEIAVTAAELRSSPAGARARVALGAAFGGLAGALVFAAGYAGTERYRPDEIFHIAGFGAPLASLVGIFALGLVLLVVLRARSPRFVGLALGAAILPGAIGTFTTYVGWQSVLGAAAGASNQHAFETIHLGYFEASATRFVGLGLTTILALALAFGLAAADRSPLHRPTALGAALLLVGAVFALGAHAPSAAVVLCVASAAVLSLGRARVHAEAPELSPFHALTAAVATLTAAGLAYTRVEARGAALWFAGATRADRVTEILASRYERDWTTLSILAAAVAVGVAAVAFVGRAERMRATRPELRRFPLGAALFTAGVLGVVAFDLYFVLDFKARRQALVAALSEQFALFAQLTPSSAEGHALPSPSEAPALQITRDAVAVNGKGAARLVALDSPGGKQSLTNAITTALAAPTASGSREVDLSVLVDRGAPTGRVLDLLAIARDSGARTVEILFTRGDPPRIPANGPPEMGHLLPSDFGALRVTLASYGLELAKDS